MTPNYKSKINQWQSHKSKHFFQRGIRTIAAEVHAVIKVAAS